MPLWLLSVYLEQQSIDLGQLIPLDPLESVTRPSPSSFCNTFLKLWSYTCCLYLQRQKLMHQNVVESLMYYQESTHSPPLSGSFSHKTNNQTFDSITTSVELRQIIAWLMAVPMGYLCHPQVGLIHWWPALKPEWTGGISCFSSTKLWLGGANTRWKMAKALEINNPLTCF